MPAACRGRPRSLTSVTSPHLTHGPRVAHARGLVLMLHGGAEHGVQPVGDRSRAWLRSRLMMAQLQRPLRRAGVEVWLLRYRLVGWNHGHAALPSPVPDARWALDQVRRERPDLPVVLLGHSMGARTAVAVADDAQVRGVVGLAPWFPADDPVASLAGKRLAAAHGRRDEITRYDESARFVTSAARVAASATLTDMGDVGHYLLKGLRRWNRFALTESLATLASPDR